MGFEPILFEKGHIPFASERPLDQSCYEHAAMADIFVLIIGGRYGMRASTAVAKDNSQLESYDSITSQELFTAASNNIPIFIAIDQPVHTEYETYSKNRDNQDVNYAYVDSTNVFKLLDTIYKMPNNNPITSFETPEALEQWLQMQWAGLFCDLLRAKMKRTEYTSLKNQVELLTQTSTTLQKYLEDVLREIKPVNAEEIITQEKQRMFAVIADMLDTAACQFIILMHEKKIAIDRDPGPQQLVPGVFLRGAYNHAYASPNRTGHGSFSVADLCEKLRNAELLTPDLDGKVSLTTKGHLFAQWLIANGRRAEYFEATGLGTWGDKSKFPSLLQHFVVPPIAHNPPVMPHPFPTTNSSQFGHPPSPT